MDISWPYPQIISDSQRNILIWRDTASSAFRLYSLGDDYSLTFICSLLDSVYGSDFTPWEAADFGLYSLAMNGDAAVYYDTLAETFQAVDSMSTVPIARSICSLNQGQLILGGITSTWYDCDETYVAWSQIGSVDCTPDQQNTAGYRRPRRGGTVYKVLQLADYILCYTSKEIVALMPKSEPAPTFGMEEVLPIGLCGRGAVGGNEKVHVFVDRSGNVWRIRDRQIERLGYSEYMLQLTAANIRISVNELNSVDDTPGEFYICDGVKCFLLTMHGMTEVYQLPTSLGVINGSLVGVCADTAGSTKARIVTDTIDFGFRPQKTVSVLELGLTAGDDADGACYYKNGYQESYTQTALSPVNNNGVVYQKISGTDFRFVVECDDYQDFYLDYIKARWKMTDMRSIRGVYSPPPRGQNVSPTDS